MRFGRVLAPVERLSEILFGLIMALTVTSAVSVATADHMQIRTMLIAALGCNLAWGIIDAGMYLMARLGERGHNAVVARAIRKAADREQAHRIIADELPSVFASIFRPAQLEEIRDKFARCLHLPRIRDWRAATGRARSVFLPSLLRPRFPSSFRLPSLTMPDWLCAYPMRLLLHRYFCAGFFLGGMLDFILGSRGWSWWWLEQL